MFDYLFSIMLTLAPYYLALFPVLMTVVAGMAALDKKRYAHYSAVYMSGYTAAMAEIWGVSYESAERIINKFHDAPM